MTKTRTIQAWVILIAVGILATVAINWTSSRGGKSSRTASRGAEPTRKQREAAEFAYPASQGAMPQGLSTEYDVAKDRTKMVLELPNIVTKAPSSYRAGSVTLKLESEFAGTVRRKDVGELSVECEASMISAAGGALSPGDPPAVVEVDGTAFDGLAPVKGVLGYHSKKSEQGIKERLLFRVHTSDMIRIASGRSVIFKFGEVKTSLAASDVAAIREFVARMNPNPKPPKG